MMKDYSGQQFGRLRVVELAGKSPHGGNLLWRCACQCGGEKIVLSTSLRVGDTKSCGCLQRELAVERATKHGHASGSTTRTYNSWASMIQRCTNPHNPGFEDYAGRGIFVCPRWMESFDNFLEDMGNRPVGCSLDRIDNDGGYEPGNCRWATRLEQSNNRRPRGTGARARRKKAALQEIL